MFCRDEAHFLFSGIEFIIMTYVFIHAFVYCRLLQCKVQVQAVSPLLMIITEKDFVLSLLG